MTTQTQRSNLLSTIILTGFIASASDAVSAVLYFFIKGGKDPVRLFQFISSAVFGKDAFAGGWKMGSLGILFHFIIAYSFTVFFFFLYKRWTALSKNIVVTAIFYGLFAWVVMNLVVLRFTRLSLKPLVAGEALAGASILIIAIGLPVTLVARKYFAKTDAI